ncbi:MAG: carbon-nitrogen hydrolase family protein [Owenweeksia sp.]|nr:carbon-nitrogen hydrolase family protein [Owenweeksia sp.]
MPTGHFAYNAKEMPGHFEKEMQNQAKKHGIWLVRVLFLKKMAIRFTTPPLSSNPEGEIVAKYRKMFPFYPYEVGVSPGNDFCIFDIPDVGRFGLSICYDMWFPETTRTLAVMGAEVILHPTMTATMDRDIEHSIDQTMAAVNRMLLF